METYGSMLAAIRKGILDQDAKKLHVAAHSFKGAAGNFGLHKAFDLAARLESMGRDGILTDAAALGEALDEEMSQVTPQLQTLLREMAACTS